MLRFCLVLLLLATSVASQPSLWLQDGADDTVTRGLGTDDTPTVCPFDGKLGSNNAAQLHAYPSGILTAEVVESNLKEGDDESFTQLNTWFLAPLYASFKRDNVQISCWKPVDASPATEVIRNNMDSNFEATATVVITWTSMTLSDQDAAFEIQAIVSSDDSGNAFAIFSYKRDDNSPSEWYESVKRVAVRLPGGSDTEYLNGADLTPLFGTSNYDSNQCCSFMLRVGDASSDMSKPALPGTCECGDGEQCADDKTTMKQRCVGADGATNQEQSAEACGTLATCHANAACQDVDGGRCCVCGSDYWGNGANCYPSTVLESSATPNVETRLSEANSEWTSLGISGTVGLSTQLNKANVDSRYWNYAPLVLMIVPWLFSDTQNVVQYVPARLTGLNFNRSLDVQMFRGGDSAVSFRLKIATSGDLSNNNLQFDLTPENEGELSVPEFVSYQRVTFKYQHKEQGVLNAAGYAAVVDADSVTYTYKWTETITFFECTRNDHVGVTDKSIQMRFDAAAWTGDSIQFEPTFEIVAGDLEVALFEPAKPSEAQCDSECTGNRQCRMNADTSQYECLCQEGFTDNGDPSAECEAVADQCGGQCSAESNTVCGAEGACVCREGFESTGSDPLTCSQIQTETCPQQCHEKANCTQVDGQWQCVCQGDYVGNETHCELSCTAKPDACGGQNERCNPTSRRCECRAGFRLFKEKRGSFCVNAQSCAHVKCRAGMQCMRRDDYNYECICKRDTYYDGSNCVPYTLTTNSSADWLVYAHGVILARAQPDSRGNISPWPLLVISDQRAVAVATDCNTGAVYWSDVKNKVIRRAYLNKKRVVPEVVITLSRASSVEGMAFDHASRNLYYTDAGTDSIVVFNVMTNKTKTVVTGTADPRGITLDLVNNKMYWVDWETANPRVERANLDGSGRVAIITNVPTSTVKYPNGIVVDGYKQLLYWADAGNGQVFKVNTATLGEQTVHFNLENLDRSWEEKRNMLFDLTLVRTNEIYATVWGLNGVVRTNDYKTFEKAPGGNGKIFGIDYYRATCPPTSSKCTMVEAPEGWKAEQCEKTSHLCFSMAHSDNPSCVCSDDSQDC